MPRNVRPAYIRIGADGIASTPSTGPRSRTGSLYATLTLRTADGDVSEPVTIAAGGQSADGSARATLDIPRSMAVDIIAPDGRTVTLYHDQIARIIVRPLS